MPYTLMPMLYYLYVLLCNIVLLVAEPIILVVVFDLWGLLFALFLPYLPARFLIWGVLYFKGMYLEWVEIAVFHCVLTAVPFLLESASQLTLTLKKFQDVVPTPLPKWQYFMVETMKAVLYPSIYFLKLSAFSKKVNKIRYGTRFLTIFNWAHENTPQNNGAAC